MTVMPGGRPRLMRAPSSEDDIIHAEQLTCVYDQLVALCAQLRHVIRVQRDLAQRSAVGLTTGERAGVVQEVSAALATHRAVAGAWDYWWTAYCQLLGKPPSSVP